MKKYIEMTVLLIAVFLFDYSMGYTDRYFKLNCDDCIASGGIQCLLA